MTICETAAVHSRSSPLRSPESGVSRTGLWLPATAALLLLLTLAVSQAARAETVVYGRVVAIEPLHARSADGQGAQSGDCSLAPPGREAGLVARLRWDLEEQAVARSRCLALSTPQSFRVTYQWNGQLFTQELPFDPGERIALRLDVR